MNEQVKIVNKKIEGFAALYGEKQFTFTTALAFIFWYRDILHVRECERT